ncbi:hypothetical protein LOK74_02080 [Brevibacillus humidisoli]|uniref:conjugal transfer protein TrbL family protein n=1 Tax=Brevibacillus humidisoli TaxID=2895522 RepID=UPI001E29F063|nr:conjugal transfer protein TrbL family protein [Brevibacillus humidisoli]UFJ41349.1 hypothetical protein LOK74_02080 [Brevibacillus humidisoli]
MDWIKQLIHESVMYSMQKQVESIVNEYMGALVYLREIILDLLASHYFTQAILYVQGIAALVLVVKISFEAWSTHILRLNGDPDADPEGLLKGGIASGAIIATAPWIVQQVWMFGLSIQRDITQLPGTDLGFEQDALLNFFLNCLTLPGTLFLGVIAALLIYLLVVFQSIIFAIETSILVLIGMWMALGLTNPQSSSFQIWWKDLLGTTLLPGVQLLTLKGAFVFWTDVNGTPGLKLLLFILLMFVAYRLPQRIQMYVAYSSSGVGRTTVNMAQTVLTKLLMKR